MNLIYGMKLCENAPRVVHLYFKNDSILFAKATIRKCSVIAEIIGKYERASARLSIKIKQMYCSVWM